MSSASSKLLLSAAAMLPRYNAFVTVSSAATLLRQPRAFFGSRVTAVHILRQSISSRAPHYATLASPRVEGDVDARANESDTVKARTAPSVTLSAGKLDNDLNNIDELSLEASGGSSASVAHLDSDLYSIVSDEVDSLSTAPEGRGPTASQPNSEKPVVPKKREIADGMGPPIEDFRISKITKERLAKNGITQTTEVQAGTYDLIYDGADIIAKSRTGTGKTLAFALPIMERLAILRRSDDRRSSRQGPGCIVLAPTRELAKQVTREMANIGEGLNLSVECFYGGVSYSPQENALRRGVDVVVGTPGRIMDHLERGTLRLHSIKFAVLDEADEMLSMGFADDVETVFKGLPRQEERQVILFSATVPSWVKNLAAQYQSKDVHLFDAVTRGTMTATTVRHCALRVPERDEARASFLADIIAVYSRPTGDVLGKEPSRTIVFTETKREADELATSGALEGCGAAVLHGDVSQKQREVTLAQFRKGRFQVLVATDVAARGLDISGVDVVVQYRLPQDSDSYIHRAGRTGRAGKLGTAVVMYNDREKDILRQLERQCKIKFERQPAPAPEMALEAAADVAISAMSNVEDRVVNQLIPRAEKILKESENPAQVIASMLAVAGRRTELSDRSVLSGEKGMRAVLVKGNTELSAGVALRFVGDIARNANIDERVGLIRICKDGSAVLDVPSENIGSLLAAAGEESTVSHDLTLEVATSVPALREEERRSFSRGDRMNGRQGYGGRRGGGGGGGGSFRDGRFADSRYSRGPPRNGSYARREGGSGYRTQDDWSRRSDRDDSTGTDFGRNSRYSRGGGGGYERDSFKGSFGRDSGRGHSGGRGSGSGSGPRRTPQLLDDDF